MDLRTTSLGHALTRRHLLLATLAAGTASPALAASGGTDVQARLLARFLAPALGVPLLVENRPGAGTMLAATELARSAPDGHTLMYTPTSTIAQLPLTMVGVKYDTFRDFTPVAQCAVGPTVLALHKDVPARDLQELAAYARAHPGELNYVSQGVGTSAHIFGQMLARQLNVNMVHVPYKGANDVTNDFLAGRVQLQFASSSGANALAKSGRVRLLGVVAPRRSGLFPELPTMAELGIQDMELDSALGLLGPAGLSPDVLARLGQATREALLEARVREDFRTSGVEVSWQDAAEFALSVRQSAEGWRRMLAQIDFHKEQA